MRLNDFDKGHHLPGRTTQHVKTLSASCDSNEKCGEPQQESNSESHAWERIRASSSSSSSFSSSFCVRRRSLYRRAPLNGIRTYRDGKKGMYILLSNSYLVLPAVVKQQQEEISRNHVPSLFAISEQGHVFAPCLITHTSLMLIHLC